MSEMLIDTDPRSDHDVEHQHRDTIWALRCGGRREHRFGLGDPIISETGPLLTRSLSKTEGCENPFLVREESPPSLRWEES